MDDNIVVALAADQNYYIGLLVTACSIARHAQESDAITWVILDGGISSKDLHSLQQSILRDHARSLFRIIPFDKNILNDVDKYNGSVMTYARLFLPRLLPDCEFVVYCDVDFLWMADISELWRLRDHRFVVQSTLDEHIYRLGAPKEEEWGRKYNYTFYRNRYFCAGLCIFNLDRLRQGVADRLIKIMQDCPSAPMADQTIMNAALDHKDIGLLPGKWQRLLVELSDEKVCGPFVLHYASVPPWKAENARLMSDAMIFWFRECARSQGISTLQAIGMVHNKAFAIFSRLVFLIAMRFKITQKFFYVCLRALKHEGYIAQCVRIPV